MKIFVTGATGFVGEEVACGLRRNGHDVLALVRNTINNPIVRRLVEQEVQIIQGDLLQQETYKHKFEDCDVIIHCAVDYKNYAQVDNIAVDTILSACASDFNEQQQLVRKKKVFLYTSGIMCYAEQANKYLTEDDLTLTEGWVLHERHINEQKVLNSSCVYGCVIRPGWVYGKRSKHFIQYFFQTLNNPSKILVTHPNKSYSQIHIDDLVRFYVMACECSSPETFIQSQIYNVADTSHYTNMEIARVLTKSMNWTGELILEDDIEEGKSDQWKFRNRTILVDSIKAEKNFGFKCKHKLMLDDTEILKASCLALHAID
jgi:nucleoside-diphosphate-sugar epimerase